MSIDPETAVRGIMRERAKLLGFALSLLGDIHLAEDVVQDVVTLAMRKSDQIRDESHLLPWARTVARNKVYELRRANRRQGVGLSDEVLELLDDRWAKLDQTDSTQRLDFLRHCMRELTERSQRILKLRYVDDQKGEQIAATLGVKVRSIYTAMTRIHSSLAECVQRRLQAADGGHA